MLGASICNLPSAGIEVHPEVEHMLESVKQASKFPLPVPVQDMSIALNG